MSCVGFFAFVSCLGVVSVYLDWVHSSHNTHTPAVFAQNRTKAVAVNKKSLKKTAATIKAKASARTASASRSSSNPTATGASTATATDAAAVNAMKKALAKSKRSQHMPEFVPKRSTKRNTVARDLPASLTRVPEHKLYDGYTPIAENTARFFAEVPQRYMTGPKSEVRAQGKNENTVGRRGKRGKRHETLSSHTQIHTNTRTLTHSSLSLSLSLCMCVCVLSVAQPEKGHGNSDPSPAQHRGAAGGARARGKGAVYAPAKGVFEATPRAGEPG